MSYGQAGTLQSAIYGHLMGDAALSALVGSAIYDAVPAGSLPPVYVRLGSEEVLDASDGTGSGAVHRITLSVITSQPGFGTAKAVAGALCDALSGAALSLSRGHLVSLRFERARARRIDAESARRIDLRFRARVSDE